MFLGFGMALRYDYWMIYDLGFGPEMPLGCGWGLVFKVFRDVFGFGGWKF